MRIVWLLSAVSALYFEISERDKKCFIEELPEDTQMTGKYLVQLFDKQSKVCITIREFALICVLFLIRNGKKRPQASECMSMLLIQETRRSSRELMELKEE